MAYAASPAPKMGLGEQENPLARLVRMMAEYYYPGGSPADPRGPNVTEAMRVPPQVSMPTSNRADMPVRMDFGAMQGQPDNPGWTTNTVQAVPYEPGMEMGGGMPPMPAPSPERMPIPTRGMMPPQGMAPPQGGIPPMPERGGRMAEMGGFSPTSGSGNPRAAIVQALMEAEKRPPLPNGPQFGTLDWWNQMGR